MYSVMIDFFSTVAVGDTWDIWDLLWSYWKCAQYFRGMYMVILMYSSEMVQNDYAGSDRYLYPPIDASP